MNGRAQFKKIPLKTAPLGSLMRPDIDKTLSETREWLRHMPNKLTLGRIAAIPLLLVLYPLEWEFLRVPCALIFAAAAATDYLDGYLARRYGMVTPLGALLDPIADKMLVAAGLVLLARAGAAPAFVCALLICRDIAVSGIRLMALEQRITIEVSEFGKWKTAITSVAIFCLMINKPLFDLPFRLVGMLCLWGALGLSAYSAWLYVQAFLQKNKTPLFNS
jgi:CDP-diacylglycerol--glycerol-3-phosphate 3-phosphatidyltransferase